MALKIEFGSMRFLTIYMALCFSLSLLFIWNNTYPPAQDHVGYPVVDDDQCGSDEERVMNVFEWAKKNGAYINPRVSTGMFPIPGDRAGTMVRGLRATGPMTRGERLFVMPSHLLLNLRMVRDDPILGRMYNETSQLADGMGGLAVLLIREALNRTSFWRPYLCSLPKHVPLPVFYSPKKLARVRGGMPEEQLFKFDSLVEARRDAIELHYVSIMPVLFLKYPGTFRSSDFTYARWAWACSIIMSRTWGRPMSDPVLNKRAGPNGTTVQTLVPAADMPNHLNGALEASQDYNGSLILRAHANLTAGDQLFISYGAKCSAEFIAHYGFIPSNNSAVLCKHAEDQAPGFNATAHWENATRWRRKWRATFAKLYAEVIDKAERSGRAHSSR